jgi:hypothetical protein
MINNTAILNLYHQQVTFLGILDILYISILELAAQQCVCTVWQQLLIHITPT